MKLTLIPTTAIVGTVMALPSTSSAAPPAPTFQASVSVTEAPAVFGGFYFVDELSATSGPNGENPTGEVAFNLGHQIFDAGPITCLAVSSNSATLNYVSARFFQIVTLHVVDDIPTRPPGFDDTFSGFLFLGRAPTDCSPTQEAGFGLGFGDITVVDAKPPPTTPGQCRNGGWEEFGFNNEGLCIAYVRLNS
jgi:hypothetical protein